MTALTIGIDASRAARARRTGTETYSLELIKALAKLSGPQRRLRLYTPHPPQHAGWPDSPHVETRVIPWPRLWTHWRLAAELRRHPPDALFVPAHVLPLYCPVPAVVTVHDLGYVHYPQTHRRFDRWYLHWSTRRHSRLARHILADSQATKNDLVDIYRADPQRVSVVYLGRDEALAPVTGAERIRQVKTRYQIEGDYLLYLGTLHPRKNLARLIEAYHLALQMLGADTPPRLVIAGQKGWLYDEIFARVQALPQVERRVIFPGYVADEDKAALLSGALAYVFPSLYEGFGLPVLEAMACGAPVLTSNVSSLPEVAGNAALLVDPLRPDEIAEGLAQLIIDAKLRRELVERGFQQVKHFSWDMAAAQVMEILEKVAGEKGGGGREKREGEEESGDNYQSPITNYPPTATILGVKIHAVTNGQTLALIEQFIAGGQPHQLCTVNPEFVVTAQRDPAFRDIINRAALALPDGIGLLKAARFLGVTPLPERVAGSDLVVKLAELSHQKGYRIYFLGAQEGVAAQAVNKLKQRYPNLQVAGIYAGSPALADNEAIVQRILPTRPDILLVAYGAPNQDKWIARNLARLQIPVCMGVGGSFDFLAETARRAPLWLQRLGLEWLHRLAMEPWRWRRIWKAVGVFSWLVLRSKF